MNNFKNKRFADGFSLLELLAVISIMAMLSTLAVTSYFSAVRGMASRSAQRNFQSMLVFARQRACIEGARVSLMVFNEVGLYDADGKTVKDWIPSYVVCKEIGRLSLVSGTRLFDEFSDLDKMFSVKQGNDDNEYSESDGVRLYNLTAGQWTMVYPYVEEAVPGGSDAKLLYSNVSKKIKAYAFTTTGKRSSGNKEWRAGDAYGVEVTPVQKLPRGFTFSGLSENDSAVQYVTFLPDGRAQEAKTFTINGNQAAGGGIYSFRVTKEGKIQ